MGRKHTIREMAWTIRLILLSIVRGGTDTRVKGDPAQLEQVLLNPVVNARDAVPNEGRLSIETPAIEIDEDYCGRNPHAFSSRFTMIAVSDTCNGTDPDDLSRIFEPFFITKEQGKATGLATIYCIAKIVGHIMADIDVDRGTNFKVYLPIRSEVKDGEASPAVRRRSLRLALQ